MVLFERYTRIMKIKEFLIKLNKESFLSGECVTGQVIVRTSDENFGQEAKVFLKFYDHLNIEWDDHQAHTIFNKIYTKIKKPFQVDFEEFFDKNNVSAMKIIHKNENENPVLEFSYDFEFQLPDFLQGTIDLPNAKCSYFIKAYITDDFSVSSHYKKGVNVFEEFFKSLSHTYCKEEVKIYNKLLLPSTITPKYHKYQTQSQHYRITITLPKETFFSDEIMRVHVEIEHSNPNDVDQAINLHKVSFKLFQFCKVYSEKPYRKSNLFNYLILHTKRKTFDEYCFKDNKIVIDEEILIPKNLLSTTSRRCNENIDVDYYDEEDDDNIIFDVIRINYKLGVEFWRNFLMEDSEINIPVLINPEA
jgi:hypothetical protein